MSGSSTSIVNIVPYIDGNGIHIPEFADVLNAFQQQYYQIFGADSYIENDSQDGQLIGVQAKAYYDVCTFAVTVFNAYGPNTAQGIGLSNVVLLNGITRDTATNSQVPLLISGTPGTPLVNAYATDGNSNQWNIINNLIIPASGEISTTGTAANPGPITAVPNSVTKIGTPINGWTGVNNPQAATPGEAAETDAALRIRQQISTAQPSVTPPEGIGGAVAAVAGVTRVLVYENTSNVTDGNGIPSHSISLVVDGGDPQAIATAIANKKTLGCGTYGNTTETIANSYGNPQTISFNRSTQQVIQGALTIVPLTGYTTAIGIEIQTALANYINQNVPIGGLISVSRLYLPANLFGNTDSSTFEVVYGTLVVGIVGGAAPSTADIQLSYSQEAFTSPSNWTITT